MNRWQTRMRICKDSVFASGKNQSIRRNFLSTVFFIILAFIVLMVFYLSLGCRPEIFGKIFGLVFSDPNSYAAPAVRYFCIFAMAALAFSFPMKNGIFNIGVSGQMLGGATASFLIISTWQKSWAPAGGQIITLLISMIIAAAIAALIGALKIYFKIHEVVSAILLNWIILLASGELIKSYMIDNNYWSLGTLKSQELNSNYTFSQQGDYGWAWSLAVTIISLIVAQVILKYTVFGHKLKTVGLSKSAAKYYGYNNNALCLSSFAISGAIAGILGVIVYTGTNIRSINFNGTELYAVPPEGFNGIAVGMIALNNPVAIFFVSILFGIFSTGTDVYLSAPTQNFAFGILIYFVAVYALLNFFKPWSWFSKSHYYLDDANKYRKFQTRLEELCQNFKINKNTHRSEIVDKKLNEILARRKAARFSKHFHEFGLDKTMSPEQKQVIFELMMQKEEKRHSKHFLRFFYTYWFSLNKGFSPEEKEILLSKMVQQGWKPKSDGLVQLFWTIVLTIKATFKPEQKEYVAKLIDQYAVERKQIRNDFTERCVNDVVNRWDLEGARFKKIAQLRQNKRPWYKMDRLSLACQLCRLKREMKFVAHKSAKYNIKLTEEMTNKMNLAAKVLRP